MTLPLRVLATKKFFTQDQTYLADGLGEAAELILPEAYDPGSIAVLAPQADVLLGGLVTRDILDAAPGLRLIQIPWTGVDNLDFDLLAGYKVPVCNSHSNARAVAEYAVALMLAATKQLVVHDRLLRQGHWGRPTRDGTGFFQPPRDLSCMVAGFVGAGAIGQRAAAMLRAFGMTCVGTGFDRSGVTAGLFDRVDHPDRLRDMVSEVDVLFVTVPLTPATRGLIDATVLSAMRPEAYLVSVSRGAVIDPGALYRVLADEAIAGAAIDTWYDYPTPERPRTVPSLAYPFHELDNLLLSPHRAGFLAGAMPHLDDAITNIKRLAAGEPLINQVDVSAGF